MSSRSRARVLFISSNGVGLGHLSRLLAVARRLPDTIDKIFLTMSQALPVIHQFGFHPEYVPCDRHTESGHATWNDWLRLTLDQILEAYSVEAVVFDGNAVYPGIADALSNGRDCPLVWVRRGMWRSDQDNTPSLALARFADLIIEPDDVASEFDSGASAGQQDGVVVVDPIRLLDPHELLDRDDSCRRLGIDPEGRYALIQLGAGNNFNFIDLIDSVIEILCDSGAVAPVIAEWLTSELGLDLWPGVPRLRCFPVSRYYRAFDFTISAAGYNSFNEIMSFGVPSVLVPNVNRAMDDQRARSQFANLHNAAIHLDPEALDGLDRVLTAMLDGSTRQLLRDNCGRIAKPNGAEQAARLIVDVVRPGGGG
jgi:hypothetical protein